MGKDDIEKGKTQAKEFKEEYGEYPTLPIRIKYCWLKQEAEGELRPTRFGSYSIFGFPGMVGIADEETSDVLFLYDGLGRLFPNVAKEMCILEPQEKK